MGVNDPAALLTDSTADLPPAEAAALDVAVVPLTLDLGGVRHSDPGTLRPEGTTELSPEALMERMRAGAWPRTAQATPAQFEAHYRLLLRRAGSVLCFPVSSTFSGTYASAVQAALPFGEQVRVVDTRTLTAGLWGALRQARAWLDAGVHAADIARRLEGYGERVFLQFAPQDLRWLIAGGRVGRLAGFAANLLSIKPVLAIVNGRVQAVGRVRGFAAAVRALAQNFPAGLEAVVLHAGNLPDAARLHALLTARGVRVLDTRIVGAVIGVHAGPGTIGVVGLPPLETAGR